jgi:hypothetical protein
LLEKTVVVDRPNYYRRHQFHAFPAHHDGKEVWVYPVAERWEYAKPQMFEIVGAFSDLLAAMKAEDDG